MGDVLLLETGTDKLLLEDGSSFLLLEVPDDSYKQLILGTTGLVSYYRLGELSTTTATDEKATNNGTYNGGYSLGQSSALARAGNTAVSFDGVNGSYVLCKAGGILGGLANLSIEFWVKTDPLPTLDKTVYGERGATGNDILKIHVVSSGTGAVQLVVRDDAGTIDFLPQSAANVCDKAWHHVLLTKAGTLCQFYVDGVASGSSANLTASDTFTNTLSSRIAGDAQDGNAYFFGFVDEVALYNVTLSAQQILDHYNYGIGTARLFRGMRPVVQAVSRAAVR